MAKNTSFSLGDHFSEFVERKVAEGRYSSASDVVRAGLRLLEEDEAKLEALRAALIEGEESGPAESFDFDEFMRLKAGRATSEVERKRILGEVSRLSRDLFLWQERAEFEKVIEEIGAFVDELDMLLGRTRNHRERVFKPWREAWILHHLLPVYRATSARLVDSADGSRPDAELKSRGRILPVEVTEALASSYAPWERPLPEMAADGDAAQWRRNANEIGSLLEAAARRKSKKPYATDAILAVYVGTGATYGIANPEITEAIAVFQKAWSDTFRAVRVLWGTTVY